MRFRSLSGFARNQSQTSAAAMGAGFVRQGDIYVKVGLKQEATGVVNPYSWFHSQEEVERALAEPGFKEMGGDDLVDFLKNKSETEAEAYFYTQKLALQTAFETVMGKGKSSERKDSKHPPGGSCLRFSRISCYRYL